MIHTAGFYRRIDTRIWCDEQFTSLPASAPCSRLLYLYLMSGDHTTNLPGLFMAGPAAIGEIFGWNVDDVRALMRELELVDLARFDLQRRVCFIPRALHIGRPANINVVKGWARPFNAVPECEAKSLWLEAAKPILRSCSELWLEVFLEKCGMRQTPAASDCRAESAPQVLHIVRPERKPDDDYEEPTARRAKEVDEIIGFYNETFSDLRSRPVRPSLKLRYKIAARLKAHGVDDIKRAITNIRQSAFHTGKNDSGKVYATLEFICRNDDKVDEWANTKRVAKATANDALVRAAAWAMEGKAGGDE